MGSNMQKQATPCIVPEAPLVGTGMEERAAKDTGRLHLAKEDGVVTAADGKRVKVKNAKGKEIEYPLVNFVRTNGFTSLHQRPSVTVGDKVKKGDLLADNLDLRPRPVGARPELPRCLHDLVGRQLRGRHHHL